jgi:DNA end-binding protein Ku
MAATVWKGHLAFGLVSIPVRLLRAARAQRVPLRQLYRPKPVAQTAQPTLEMPEQQPSRYTTEITPEVTPEDAPEVVTVKRVYQPDHYEPVQKADLVTDLVKGYETTKGEYVVFDEQELRQIATKTSTEIEIVEFVRFNEIDPVYLETSYYLVPEATGEKAYALLFGAMREEGYAAVAKVSMHRRDHVLIVRPGKTGLIAHTMFYSDEVRTLEEFRTDTTLASGKELELAKALVEALAKPFEPDQFQNQFRAQLNQLIESRAAERRTTLRITPEEAPKSGKVIDIMDALRRSLLNVKPAEVKPADLKPASAPAPTPPRKPARGEQAPSRKRSTKH